MGKLLGIFAQPFDESIASGGTISKYAKAGWQVDLVCAGKSNKEHKDAVSKLGVASIAYLDYEENSLAGKMPGELEDKFTGLMEEMKPDVVLTQEPSGVTHHPDQKKIALATTFAFQKYAWIRHDEDSLDKNPPKLYYVCLPKTVVTYLIKSKQIPAEINGEPFIGVDDKRITTVINVKRGIKKEYFIFRMIGLTEVFMGKNDRVSDRL